MKSIYYIRIRQLQTTLSSRSGLLNTVTVESFDRKVYFLSWILKGSTFRKENGIFVSYSSLKDRPQLDHGIIIWGQLKCRAYLMNGPGHSIPQSQINSNRARFYPRSIFSRHDVSTESTSGKAGWVILVTKLIDRVLKNPWVNVFSLLLHHVLRSIQRNAIKSKNVAVGLYRRTCHLLVDPRNIRQFIIGCSCIC